MQITLISTATFPSDQGIRTISSVLKKAGHEVKIFFLAYSEDYKKFYPKFILNPEKYFLRNKMYKKFFNNFVNNRFTFKSKEFLHEK